MRIRRISPTGAATVSATATTILMLLLSLSFVLSGGSASALGLPPDMLANGTVAFIVMIIIYFVVTWIFTAIWTLILNLALECAGGLRIETSE